MQHSILLKLCLLGQNLRDMGCEYQPCYVYVISEHATHSLSGPVLQAMLMVLHKVDQSQSDNICTSLIKKTGMFTIQEDE